jgi:hypothetical protein
MFGHLRFCLAAFFVLAGLSTSYASSNFLDFLFNPASEEVAAPAPAEQGCLPQPGKSTIDGRHWVYRIEGRRKCWFQAAAGVATVKKPGHDDGAKQRASAATDAEFLVRKRKAIDDAYAEVPRPATAETLSTPPVSEPRLLDSASVSAMGPAALAPPAPVKAASDQLTQNRDSTPPQVNVEALLAMAPPVTATSSASSARPAIPAAVPIAEADDGAQEWMATWLGVLLIALGFVFLLRSSRIFPGRPSDAQGATGVAGVAAHASHS